MKMKYFSGALFLFKFFFGYVSESYSNQINDMGIK